MRTISRGGRRKHRSNTEVRAQGNEKTRRRWNIGPALGARHSADILSYHPNAFSASGDVFINFTTHSRQRDAHGRLQHAIGVGKQRQGPTRLDEFAIVTIITRTSAARSTSCSCPRTNHLAESFVLALKNSFRGRSQSYSTRIYLTDTVVMQRHLPNTDATGVSYSCRRKKWCVSVIRLLEESDSAIV